MGTEDVFNRFRESNSELRRQQRISLKFEENKTREGDRQVK